MATIRVTPEELNAQGGDLISYSEELAGTLNEIGLKIQEITDSWDGLAQDAYWEMYQTLNESLKTFPELVKSLGEATQSAAEAFASVDEQLQQGFNKAL